jgi:hypothetical protein
VQRHRQLPAGRHVLLPSLPQPVPVALAIPPTTGVAPAGAHHGQAGRSVRVCPLGQRCTGSGWADPKSGMVFRRRRRPQRWTR